MNVVVARSYERLADNRRGAVAANRVSPSEIMYVMYVPAVRDQGRLWLAAGDTAAALGAWHIYLSQRSREETTQRKADDEIRRKVDELLRGRR